MNPTIITARVTDQRLRLVNEALVASGGVDVLQIRFEFCNLWDGCGKTAVFYRDPEEVYHVPVIDDLVTVPWEVLSDEGYFYFGVFGVKSNRRPTEAIRIKVVRGVLTEATATPEDPTPDIYEQLMAAYGQLESRLNEIIAPRFSTDNMDTFEIQGDNFSASFTGNGVACEVRLHVSDMFVRAWQNVQSEEYMLPLFFAPLADVTLVDSTEPGFEVGISAGEILLDEGVRLVRFTFYNNTDTGASFTQFPRALYPVAIPILPELIDIRVGANSTTYETAGESVRKQIGDVDAALDHIIAIQEHFINGKPLPISFNLYSTNDLTGTNYTAEEGMDWAEWCASEYNTIGARISGPGEVIVDGGRLWLDAGNVTEVGTNTIVADGRYLIG